jgi:hypothetical protein
MTQGRYKAEYYGMQEWSILKDGKEIVPGGLTEGTAKELVRAVNNHAALVEAVRYALADLEGIMPDFDMSGDRLHPAWATIDDLRTALKNAQE